MLGTNLPVRRLVPQAAGLEDYALDLKALTAESNERLFRMLEEPVLEFQHGRPTRLDAEEGRIFCEQIRSRLVARRNSFVADHLYRLMDTMASDCAQGPVIAPQVH